MFPEKKSSRERSRLGLPSWRNTRSSLILSFSLLSSAQLPTSSQLRTFTASAFQLVFPFLLFLFFFSLSPSLFLLLSFFLSRIPGVRTCGRKAFSSVVSSRKYLSSFDYQQLPFLICTTICCVSHEYINYLLAFFRVFTRA